MKLKQDPRVPPVFERYPKHVKNRMLYLRNLIIEVAEELEDVTQLEETLKWGEPSYLTKHGSTVRIDWKEKTSDQYAVYFKCTSKLVPTFRALHNGLFEYEENRALLFRLEQDLPEPELKQCISMALRYHKLKHLPNLGA